MSEHHRETEFLKHCLRYDESPECWLLEDKLAQIQRDERSIRRAIGLMILLAALATAGLGYMTILKETFSPATTQLIVKIAAVLGLAAMICLVVFMVLKMIYRKRLDEGREECRKLVEKFLAARLSKPVRPSGPDNRIGSENRPAIHNAGGSHGSSSQTESSVRG